jgi:UDP-N-acetylmuramate--alanine ligase
MDVFAVKRVYLIGIGGIGMSALARFFKERGAVVRGYDRSETPLTQQLEAEGMFVYDADDPSHADERAELVIYTPAIPANNHIFAWYKAHDYTILKRSDVLQQITELLYAITVAGTHGKTTISTMIAYLLQTAGAGCNAFLGGISVNYDTNYWSSSHPVAVVEADEYDRSFLKLHPDIAVLTAVDADHLDIYGSVYEMENAFIQYTRNIEEGGRLVLKHGLHRSDELRIPNTVTYSLHHPEADVHAHDIVEKNGGYEFSISAKEWDMRGLRLNIGGLHNVENAVAAIIAAKLAGVSLSNIADVLPRFRGVKRRFEYVVKTSEGVYIDDYAHHPEELRALISSAQQLFPQYECVVCFQPHLYSRTRDLAEGFAHSLDLADRIFLLDIYPARELPIDGISSETIAEKMRNPAHAVVSKEDLLAYIETEHPKLLITAGAGDIDKLAMPIKEILERS